jgi:hypothetical protein
LLAMTFNGFLFFRGHYRGRFDAYLFNTMQENQSVCKNFF